MALVYKRSTKNSARRYERSSGMESNRGLRSNPGVNALTVVNSGRPRDRDGRFLSGRASGRAPKANPFQWIGGRKQHIHMSPQYRDLRGAKRWMGNHPDDLKGRGRARLYATDEYGTVLTRAIPKRLLKNPTRRSGMAYNIGALRRAMRANYAGSEGTQSLLTAARASDTGGSKPRRRSSGPSESASSGGMTIASSGSRPRKRRTATGQRDAHVRARARHLSAKKGARTRKRKAAAARTSKPRTSRRRTSKRGGSKRTKAQRSASAKKAARTRKRNASKRGGSRRGSRRSSKRRSSRRGMGKRSYFHGRRARLTGREYIDKYLTKGLMPTITRIGRLPLSRSGRPSIMTYPIPRGIGRLSSSKSVRGSSRRGYAVGATYRGRKKRRMTALAANRRRRSRRNSRRRVSRNGRRRSRRSSRRGSRLGSRRRGSRRRMSRNAAVQYATANGRRRRSRRNSRRRGSRRGYVVMNRRRSRRNSRRRGSRRRMSRNQTWAVVRNGRRRSRRSSRRRGSRRRMTRNMLAVSKLKYRGSGSHRVGTPKGRTYQLVEFGPKSGRKYRHAGYPVLVPPHVSRFSYVRKFRFGGAAKDAHARAKAGGYAERRRYSRWRKPPASFTRKSSRKKMTANRRSSRKRSSMRRNQHWVKANRRHRRVRRNTGLSGVLGGADLMRDVVTPVIGGTVGFIAARVLSNSLANVAQLRGMLDSGATDAAGASNTKIAANLLGIAATLGLSTKVGIIRQNRGALVTGMGLALTDRLIQRFAASNPSYANYLGEYVDQPMNGFGEYVDQPMSGLGQAAMYAAAGIGEYVDQPMSGLGQTMFAAAGVGQYAEGVDPGDQENVEAMLNGMEGVEQAAAGMGEVDARLNAMWGKNRPPFTSTFMPEGVALPVTATLPLDRNIQTSLVTPEAKVGSLSTPEGKGFAGGLFARNLFGGMF